jgi:hypothetical protein
MNEFSIVKSSEVIITSVAGESFIIDECLFPNIDFKRLDIKCIDPKCLYEASFGYKHSVNRKKFLYCSMHKKEGMIYLRYRICEGKDCKEKATHGLKVKKYCEVHCKDNMKKIKKIKCDMPQCKRSAIFGYNRNRIYCKKHKLHNMIKI